MGAVGRIIIIVVVVLVVALGAMFFLLPNTASRTETLTIERPQQTVYARLASTPVGAEIADGVTVAEPATAEGDTITAPVTFGDGATGRVIYTVTPQGEATQVRVRLEQDIGGNPMARFGAIGGGPVAPLIQTAAANVTSDLNALPAESFATLNYSIVEVQAQPFFYAENCVPNEPDDIVHIIREAVAAIPPAMRVNNLQPAGPLMAVEPRVVAGQYCFQVGYPYSGRAPRAQGLFTKAGQTPSGTMLRIVYTGTEADVYEQVYNPMDALLAAARLDDPTTREDDWTTYEVYHDDPLQEGGSRNREIFYVTSGDIAVLQSIAPASAAAPVPQSEPAATEEAAPAEGQPAEQPAEEPAEAPATP